MHTNVWRSLPIQPVPYLFGDRCRYSRYRGMHTNAALDNIGQGLHVTVLIARIVSRAAVLELCHLALDSTVLCCVHWIACIARKHGQTFAVHSQFGYIALHYRSALHSIWMCSIDLHCIAFAPVIAIYCITNSNKSVRTPHGTC